MKESKSSDKKLAQYRAKIDQIDGELLRLLAKRTEIVDEVGELKRSSGEKSSFIRPGREATMIKELAKTGAGKFPKEAIVSIWRTIISASLSVENDLKIAVLRNTDFDSTRVITGYFGSFTKYALCKSTDEILDKVEKGAVGVVDISGNWWAKLANEKYLNLKVFAKLDKNLYAIAKVKPEETGHDKTLVVSKTIAKHGKELAHLRSFKLFEATGFKTEIQNGIVIGSYSF